MRIEPYKLLGGLLVTGVLAWTAVTLGVMLYYGSFVVRGTSFPRGGEAQLGVLIGYFCALPGLLVLTLVAWAARERLPKRSFYLPMSVLLLASLYLAYLRFLVLRIPPS